jgi:hypothetical protein
MQEDVASGYDTARGNALTTRIGGVFWTPEIPERALDGHLTAELGEMVEVTLEAALSAGFAAGNAPAPRPAPKPGDLAGAMRAAAGGWVAKTRAIWFWGELDTGELVSILDAVNDA